MGGSTGATVGGTPAHRRGPADVARRTARTHRPEVPGSGGVRVREDSRTFREVDSASTGSRPGWARSVGQGDQVAVLMGNSIEMVEAIFAGWRLGAIVVPVNFRLVAREVERARRLERRAVVVDEALLPLVDAVQPSLATLGTVIVLGLPGRPRRPTAWPRSRATKTCSPPSPTIRSTSTCPRRRRL